MRSTSASSLPAAFASRHPLSFFSFFSQLHFFVKKIQNFSEQSGRWFRFKASYEAHRRCWKRTEDAIAQVLVLVGFSQLVGFACCTSTQVLALLVRKRTCVH